MECGVEAAAEEAAERAEEAAFNSKMAAVAAVKTAESGRLDGFLEAGEGFFSSNPPKIARGAKHAGEASAQLEAAKREVERLDAAYTKAATAAYNARLAYKACLAKKKNKKRVKLGAWEGVIWLSHEVSHLGGTTIMTGSARALFEFNETKSAEIGGEVYTVRNGDFSYRQQVDEPQGNRPCRTITTAAGQIPTGPYRPGVEGGNGEIVFLGGSQYFATGVGVVRFTDASNCNATRLEIIKTRISEHFWWLQSTGAVSGDGKTMEGSQDIPDGQGGMLRCSWKLKRK